MATVVPFTSSNQTTLGQADANAQAALAKFGTSSFRSRVRGGVYSTAQGAIANGAQADLYNYLNSTGTVVRAALETMDFAGSVVGMSGWQISSATQGIQYRVIKNGAVFIVGNTVNASSSGSTYSQQYAKGTYAFAPGDTLYVNILNVSGSSITSFDCTASYTIETAL